MKVKPSPSAVEAPFVVCPKCQGLGFPADSKDMFDCFCDACNSTGKVYKLPDPLRPMRAKVEWDVVAMVVGAFIMLAYFLLKGILR